MAAISSKAAYIKGLRRNMSTLVQPEAYDWIESCVKDVFFSEDGEV